MQKVSVAGIILAAGAASRMGDNKLLLPFRGKTVIRSVVDAACASSLEPLFVVVGRDAEQVRAKVNCPRVSVVENSFYRQGHAGSLKKGLESVPEICAGAMFLLGDQPLLQTETIDILLAAFAEDTSRWVAPLYRERRGNPVIVPREWFDRVQGLSGDIGPREFLKDPQAKLNLVAVGDEGVVFDVDTPEDYDRICQKNL